MMRTILTALALSLSGLALAAVPAHAERSCSDSIGAATVSEDVVVPDEESCVLQGTQVEGDVLVGKDASLLAQGVKVDGSIRADEYRRVVVEPFEGERSEIAENVQLESGGVDYVRSATIGGNLQIARSSAGHGAVSNKIGGNFQLFANQARYLIFGNEIAGDLQCASNEPAPYGGKNAVEGNAEGQCERLAEGDPGPPDVIDPRVGIAGPVFGLGRDAMFVWTMCNEACDLRAAALIVVRDRGNVARINTTREELSLKGNDRKVVQLGIPADRTSMIAGALSRPGSLVRVWVRVIATDPSGNQTTKWRIKRMRR